ncbi:MAG TPA: MFS transporter permease [Micromonosporaceae bacterium]
MTGVDLTHRAGSAVVKWFTEPVPKGRIAAFRTVVYLFVVADLTYFTTWIRDHVDVPGSLYQPLFIGRVLPLPVPTPGLVTAIFWTLLVTSLLAATGRFPRLLGWTVFALYFEWMIIAMSYGKVDHDRIAFLVALAVLPTLGRSRHGDRTLTEAGGWALRLVQIAVIATYFLAAWAKLRYAGIDWLTGATLTRAVLRRGTWFSNWTVEVPGLLIFAQFAIVAFELFSPVIFFVKPRWRYWLVAYFYGFHLVTYLALTIAFWPHLAAMLCFLPLERIRPVAWLLSQLDRERAPSDRGPTPSPAPAEP